VRLRYVRSAIGFNAMLASLTAFRPEIEVPMNRGHAAASLCATGKDAIFAGLPALHYAALAFVARVRAEHQARTWLTDVLRLVHDGHWHPVIGGRRQTRFRWAWREGSSASWMRCDARVTRRQVAPADVRWCRSSSQSSNRKWSGLD
jgi:hypothetical protein